MCKDAQGSMVHYGKQCSSDGRGGISCFSTTRTGQEPQPKYMTRTQCTRSQAERDDGCVSLFTDGEQRPFCLRLKRTNSPSMERGVAKPALLSSPSVFPSALGSPAPRGCQQMRGVGGLGPREVSCPRGLTAIRLPDSRAGPLHRRSRPSRNKATNNGAKRLSPGAPTFCLRNLSGPSRLEPLPLSAISPGSGAGGALREGRTAPGPAGKSLPVDTRPRVGRRRTLTSASGRRRRGRNTGRAGNARGPLTRTRFHETSRPGDPALRCQGARARSCRRLRG